MPRTKTGVIVLRVSPEERQRIEEQMQKLGSINMSDYIRHMAIHGAIIKPDIPELDEIGRVLRYTSNNMNQIAKRVNSGDDAEREDVAQLAKLLEHVRLQFGQVLQGLNRITQ